MVIWETGVVCLDGPISYEPKLKTTSQLSPEAGNISRLWATGYGMSMDFHAGVQQILGRTWQLQA